MRSTPTKIEVFSSFEEENAAEHRRLAAMSPDERCEEMAVLQEKCGVPSGHPHRSKRSLVGKN